MKIWHLIISGICALVLGFWVYDASLVKSPYVEITMLDVGQGDAILVTDPTGYQMLIDGGPTNDVLGQLESVMPLFDTTIDTMLLSHPDADHVFGLSAVLEKYSVSTIIDNNVAKDTEAARRFRQFSQQEPGVKREQMFTGDQLRFPSGAHMTVLSPSENFHDPEINNYSIIAKFQYGDVSVLFTGDIDATIESRLIDTIALEDLHSTVLKIPHHGSRYSSSIAFLKYVRPQFALASYGCDNDYGHPNPATVRRYEYFQIPVYTTCDRGTFTLQTDGKTIWLKE